MFISINWNIEKISNNFSFQFLNFKLYDKSFAYLKIYSILIMTNIFKNRENNILFITFNFSCFEIIMMEIESVLALHSYLNKLIKKANHRWL